MKLVTQGLQKTSISIDSDTTKILEALPSAYASPAELKRFVLSFRNQIVLVNTPGLRETEGVLAMKHITTNQDQLINELFGL